MTFGWTGVLLLVCAFVLSKIDGVVIYLVIILAMIRISRTVSDAMLFLAIDRRRKQYANTTRLMRSD